MFALRRLVSAWLLSRQLSLDVSDGIQDFLGPVLVIRTHYHDAETVITAFNTHAL
ncbi:hypothetical protein D3C85_1386090 [compost metagenome]